MTDNQAAENSLHYLEFDLDVILNGDPHLPASVLPRMIAAADDQQTLSTLDRDQSLLTQDEPPLRRVPQNHAQDRFVDEEAPNHQHHRMDNKKLADEPQYEADEDLHGSGVSIKVLYIAAFTMSLLLLALITGLTIWLISLAPTNVIDQTASDDDLGGFPFIYSPNSFPTPAPSVATTPTPLPLTPVPTTSKPTMPPTLAPTDEPIAIQQARAHFLNILEERSYSLLQTLQQPESSRFQAYDWLIRDPNFFSYNSDRVIQRWVLALFAMGLSSSSDNTAQQKQSTNSLPPPLQTWVQYTDECTWFHSKDTLCNDQGQYVRIDLRSLNLSGTLPSEISLLSNSLEFIFLYDNQFHGTLPTHLGLLHKLERLQVTRNSFEGTIPTEIGQLDNLVLLGAGLNALTGPLPSEMGQMERLHTIGLERNAFSSTIPTEFGNMVETRLLNIDRNELSGPIPTNLNRLTLLEGLNLSFNSLQGTVPDGICQLQQLEYLEADCADVQCPCCTTCHYF